MLNKSIGFIGGGRITRIFIERMIKTDKLPPKVIVSDTNDAVLSELKQKFPVIEKGNNIDAAGQELVIVSLHPPVFADVMREVKEYIKKDSLLLSLAPKITIAKISEMLNGFDRIIRMNPNSPSIIGEGFNPVVFAEGISSKTKNEMKDLFAVFGNSPEVKESLLETYAVITAMGPTYLQFQFEKISEMAVSFGISGEEVKNTISKMVEGAVQLWANSNYSFEEVYNMVPVKPMLQDEETIKNIYNTRLNEINNKLKS